MPCLSRILPRRLPDGGGTGARVLRRHADAADFGSAGFRPFSPLRSLCTPLTPSPQQPCFDQPAEKATFAVSLISPAGLTSLSNTSEVACSASDGRFPRSEVLSEAFLSEEEGHLADGSEEEDATATGSDWELVTFEPTPKMSTYLVAWAVGQFR